MIDPIAPSTAPLPAMRAPRAVQALTPEDVVAMAPEVHIGEARKLVSRVHRAGALPDKSPPEVRRRSLERVRELTCLPTLRLVVRSPSAVDPFVKYSLATREGGVIEAVRIPLEREGRVSVCVSSQVGCGLGCTFCATGRLGLRRNLEAWEIVEQVRIVRADLPEGMRVHGVVFQGMGEPLSNFQEVKQAARVLSEPCAQAIDARNITVSTAGLPAGIRALAQELPRLRLALSLGSARREVRRTLMPIDAAQPLDKVLEAVGEHVAVTGNVPLFAYTLLAGHNDGDADAVALAALVRDFTGRYGRRPRLSLIPYNAIGGDDPFVRSDDAAEGRFVGKLIEQGVVPKRRYSGGGDVGAACGQLATPSFTP
jgi:23S rRNA (adenine2503-C2)-methyltransferase